MPRPSIGKEALRNIASRRSAPGIRINGGTTMPYWVNHPELLSVLG